MNNEREESVLWSWWSCHCLVGIMGMDNCSLSCKRGGQLAELHQSGDTFLALISWINRSEPPKRQLGMGVIDRDLYVVKGVYMASACQPCRIQSVTAQIARFMGPTWGLSGADRTQVGPMLAPWTLLSGWVTQIWTCSVIGSAWCAGQTSHIFNGKHVIHTGGTGFIYCVKYVSLFFFSVCHYPT